MQDKLLYVVIQGDVADEDNAAVAGLIYKKDWNKIKKRECVCYWGELDSADVCDPLEDLALVSEVTMEQALFLNKVGADSISAGRVVFLNKDDEEEYLDDYFVDIREICLENDTEKIPFSYDDLTAHISKKTGFVSNLPDEYDISKLISINDKYLKIEDDYGIQYKYEIKGSELYSKD